MYFHYTTYFNIPAIYASGALKPFGPFGVSDRGLVWFSSADPWEPIAGKCLDASRGLRRLTFEQQADGLGCARFAIKGSDVQEMMTWPEAAKFLCLDHATTCGLEKEAIEIGSVPFFWRATPQSVSLNLTTFEVWERNKWRRADIAAIAKQLAPLVEPYNRR